MPAAWREQLAARGVRTGRSLLHHEVAAADGTRKFLLQVCADESRHRGTVAVLQWQADITATICS